MRSAKRGRKRLALLVCACMIAAGMALAATQPRRELKPSKPEPSHFDSVTLDLGSHYSWGSASVDHDRDGWPELLIGRHKSHAVLFENARGKLRAFGKYELPVIGTPPAERTYYDRHSCAWGEANDDGRADLYCASGAQKGVGTGPNQLLLQGPKGALVDATDRFGVADLLGRGRSVNWLDYDADGLLDIFVGNESRAGYPNVMFRNTGAGFEPVSVGIGVEMSTRHSSWADIDNDGDPDLLVTSEVAGQTVLYRNVGGTFQAVYSPGISGRPWRSATWGDLDGDGWTDIALTDDHTVLVMRNRRGTFKAIQEQPVTNGRVAAWIDYDNDSDLDLFIVQGAPELGGRNEPDFLLVQEEHRFRRVDEPTLSGPLGGNGDAVSVADIDGDGRLDLVVTNGFSVGPDAVKIKGRTEVLLNRWKAGAWTKLLLHGPASNPFGFGARIQVRAGGRSNWRAVTDGTLFKSQSDVSSIHLGIGRRSSVRVKVLWPDGSHDCTVADADTTVAVTWGTSPCR